MRTNLRICRVHTRVFSIRMYLHAQDNSDMIREVSTQLAVAINALFIDQ